MQRDVEVEFDNVDKTGGFIGTLWVNKTENVALSLVKEGLASVHDYSAEGLSWFKQLQEAEVRPQSSLFPFLDIRSIGRGKEREEKCKSRLYFFDDI